MGKKKRTKAQRVAKTQPDIESKPQHAVKAKSQPSVKTKEIPLAKYWKGIFSCAFAIAVFLFYYLSKTHLLSYHEGSQMFLFTADYFTERIVVPGGLARYLAEFLTQFYYYPWLGSAIIAILMGLVQWACWKLAKRNGAREIAFPLSFIPALLLWGYMGDSEVMLSYAVAVVAALLSCLLFRISVKGILVAFPFVVVFYLLFGTTVYIVALYLAIAFIIAGIREKHPLSNILLSVLLLIWTAVIVWLSTYIVPYPVSRIFQGIPFYNKADSVPSMQIHIMWIAVVVCFIMALLSRWKIKPILTALIAIVLVAVGMKMVSRQFDNDMNYLIHYDALVRGEQWDKILELAKSSDMSSTMSVACADLALAMKGQLEERLFDFPQSRPEGLFLFMQRDMFSINTIGEIFLQLGLVNDARQFFFDSQESILNFNKSVRLTKRLAEIEIINGQYDVARKYLGMLSNTMFYDDWAKAQLALLKSEDAVNRHPFYGKLRKYRIPEDYFSVLNDLFDYLKVLCEHNPDNDIAAQYLSATLMMSRTRNYLAR